MLITGATGTIGRLLTHALALLNEEKNNNVKIIALGRNEIKGSQLSALKGVQFIKADIRELLEINEAVNYIIHCAAVTDSATMLNDPVGVIHTELHGGINILDFAQSKQVKNLIYMSSMEAYGVLENPAQVYENDLGYLDLTNPRNSYPQAKRMLENLCTAYYSQHKLPINVLRLGQTFGAGASDTLLTDNRVFAQFARNALNREDIVLHTAGKSVRSFCYMSDGLRAIFLVLLHGQQGEIYNVATTDLSIRQLAERVAKRFNVKATVIPPADLGEKGYASELMLPLNADKLKQLGWKPQVVSVEEMYERLLKDMYAK